MCGIVGYVGTRNAVPVVLDALRRVEYRGYDSAGLAVVNGHGVQVRRRAGKLKELEALLAREPVAGPIGIGHTRWATHGRPSETNAHPHADCAGGLVVVHNGIIENHGPLKERLAAAGHQFRSETDTEVIAHLVEAYRAPGVELVDAVQRALQEVRGAYAVAVLAADTPDHLVVAKHGGGSVVVGFGDGETYVASDIPALLRYTRDVAILEDGDIAVVSAAGAGIRTLAGHAAERPRVRINWDPAMAEKAGYPHFMLKEIHEQPRAVADTFRGRTTDDGAIVLPEARLEPRDIRRLRRVVLVACGTSYHAALVGRSMIERLAGLPTEVDIASEFRYRDLILRPDTLVVAVSQSGETADTLAAAKAASERGAMLLAVTNVVDSALARRARGAVYTHAGPEIGVASSKTFTSTVTALYLLALALGRGAGYLSPRDMRKRVDDLLEIPQLMTTALGVDAEMAALARELVGYRSFLYLGRGAHHAIALEGALKLKELSYVHAEGYAAGEMKHGPIALIDDYMPVVALVPRDASYDRMLSNLQEVHARDGRIIAIADGSDAELHRLAHRVIAVPGASDLLAPLLTVIPLQFLAYHLATLRGLDVDQPRNLAKSVTVE